MRKLNLVLIIMSFSMPLSAQTYKGQYGGSPYSGTQYKETNPYAPAPKLYDSSGNYRGKLSDNQYDPDSVSNPYGKFGSKYSSESINNPYGAGSKYNPESPNNPYGKGLSVYEDD